MQLKGRLNLLRGVFVELSEFARQILFSSVLSDKLETPASLSDRHPMPSVAIPREPNRPEALALGRWRTSPRVSFPSRSGLSDPVQVGVLLHFFANHELLALELMALALLKFPDAPAPFRQGIAKTMFDEQRHLASYINQMRTVGIEFGDIPVNDFFWSHCASMSTPLDYVSRMSLTFEQANLDFASYFRDVLMDVGDHVTARLLQTVLDDEIGHVKHGLAWFRRWKPDSSSDWQAFCRALGGELNPARAKGTQFFAEPRISAGLSTDFIESLRVYSQSKGGVSRLCLFNPEAEEELRREQLGLVPKGRIAIVRMDLEPVMLFVLNQTDILWLSQELPKDFLLVLKDCGFDLPERMVADKKRVTEFVRGSGRRISHVHAWAHVPSVSEFTQNLGLEGTTESVISRDSLRKLYSKTFSLALVRDFLNFEGCNENLIPVTDLGVVVPDTATFNRVASDLSVNKQHSKFVAKRPWSASGRHRIVGSLSESCFVEQPELVQKWFEKSWRHGEDPIVQPLFNRRMDFSVQAKIECLNGQSVVHKLGFTRILNHANGQYCGNVVGRFLTSEPTEILKFWYGLETPHGRGVEPLLNRLVQWTGDQLARVGYLGSFGIDCFIYDDSQGGLKLHPMIEINPRHTMGRVALSLGRRMAPGRTGLWLHVPLSWLNFLGVDSFHDLKPIWQAELPLLHKSQSGGTVILSGLLETTPAESCEQVWTCFLVTQDLQRDLQRLGLERLIPFNGTPTTTGKPVLQL